MQLEIINKSFEKLIFSNPANREITLSSSSVRYLRHRVKHNKVISLEMKLRVLSKTDWFKNNNIYSTSDLISLVSFVLTACKNTSELHADQLLNQFQKIAA